MTKVVVSGYYGFGNFGDETILSILLKHLKKITSDITVISENPDFTKNNYGVNSVKRFDLKNIFAVIKNSDVLISGGGSLLQNVTSSKSLAYYLFIIALGVLLNKKVIIFAQGIGPIKGKLAQIFVKYILRCCHYISVRDQNSLNLLESWGLNSDLVCDPVYSLEGNMAEKTHTVGIQLRNFKTMNLNLLQKLAMLINSKFSGYRIEIFSLQKSQDYDLSIRFENILHSINPDIKTEIISDNIVENLSKLEYLIGMRFHALLVALKFGVKCCAINYDIKVEKLAKDYNLPIISMTASENFEQIYQDMQNLSSQNILQAVNSKSFDWKNFDELLIRSH